MLHQGEYAIAEEGASHFHQSIAVGGTLILTNKRLIFRSSPCFSYPHFLEIDLNRISDIQFFKHMLLNPTGLAVVSQDGNLENFIVDDRKAWRERILSTALPHRNQ